MPYLEPYVRKTQLKHWSPGDWHVEIDVESLNSGGSETITTSHGPFGSFAAAEQFLISYVRNPCPNVIIDKSEIIQHKEPE